jgi:transcriptional regulator with XRE-family HTH domain
VGERVRALRITLGWSQEELARRAGLHRNFISAVERGRLDPSPEDLLKIGIIPEKPG